MFVSFCISVVILVLLSVCVADLSLSNAVVKDTYFSYGETSSSATGVTDYIYLGIRRYVLCIGKKCEDGEEGINWDDTSCVSSFCNNCRDASTRVLSTIIISFVTEFPTAWTKLTRSTIRGDSSCQKYWGLATLLLSLCSNFGTIGTYSRSCYSNLPELFQGEEVTWRLGPGLILLFVATILKVIDIIIFLIVPVEAIAGGSFNRPYGTKDTKASSKLFDSGTSSEI